MTILRHIYPRNPLDIDMTIHLLQYAQTHKEHVEKLVYEMISQLSLASHTTLIKNKNEKPRGRDRVPTSTSIH